MDFRQQPLAGWWVEVGEEVCQEHEIVSLAKLLREHAAGNRTVAVGNARRLGVFSPDREDARPVERDDFRLRVLSGDGDPVEAMAGGDVEYLDAAAEPVNENETVGFGI